jgi:hypothetical protein
MMEWSAGFLEVKKFRILFPVHVLTNIEILIIDLVGHYI